MSEKRPDVVGELIWIMRRQAAPSTPVPYTENEAIAGIAMLDLAMSMNHVVRESERIRLDSPDSLSRVVTLDLALYLLTEQQLHAASRYNVQRRTPGETAPTPYEREPRSRAAWLPLLQLARVSGAHVEVRSETGAVLPQISQPECLSILAAGLCRMFRFLLRAYLGPGSSDTYGGPKAWLIEQAIFTYVQDGPPGRGDAEGSLAEPSTGDPGEGSDTEVPIHEKAEALAEAERLLKGLREKVDAEGGGSDDEISPWKRQWEPFFHLLRKVGDDYLIICALDLDQVNRTVSYQAPSLARTPNKFPWQGWSWREDGIRWFRRHVLRYVLLNDAYKISYQRECRTSLREYRVSFEAFPSISTRYAGLTSERDEDLLSTVKAQHAGLSCDRPCEEQGQSEEATGAFRVLDAQRQLRAMQPVLERRRAQLVRYQDAYDDTGRAEDHNRPATDHAEDQGGDGASPVGPAPANGLVLPDELSDLLLGSADQSSDRPEGARNRVDRALETFEQLELGQGLGIIGDAKPNRGNTAWRVSSDQLTPRAATRTYRNRFTANLTDDSHSFVGQVSILLGLLLLIVLLVGASLKVSGRVGQQAGATDVLVYPLVPSVHFLEWVTGFDLQVNNVFNPAAVAGVMTLVLLVPVALLARLEAARGDLVVRWLRAPARFFAYVGVFMTVMLALALGTADPSGPGSGTAGPSCAPDGLGLCTLDLAVITATLTLEFLTVVACLRWVSRRLPSRGRYPVGLAPSWLATWGFRRRFRHYLARRRIAVDAEFSSDLHNDALSVPTDDRTSELAATVASVMLSGGESTMIRVDRLPDVVVLGPRSSPSVPDNGGEPLAQAGRGSDSGIGYARDIVAALEQQWTDDEPRLGRRSADPRRRRQQPFGDFGLPGTSSGFRKVTAVLTRGPDRQSLVTSAVTWSPGSAPVPDGPPPPVSVPPDRPRVVRYDRFPGFYVQRQPTSAGPDTPRLGWELYVEVPSAGVENSGPTQPMADLLKAVAEEIRDGVALLRYCEWPGVRPAEVKPSEANGDDAVAAPAPSWRSARIGVDIPISLAGRSSKILLDIIRTAAGSAQTILVRDGRAGSTGSWHEVIKPDPAARSSTERLVAPAPSCSVTLAGPTRNGVTARVLSAVEHLPIQGLSETSAGGYSILHLWFGDVSDGELDKVFGSFIGRGATANPSPGTTPETDRSGADRRSEVGMHEYEYHRWPSGVLPSAPRGSAPDTSRMVWCTWSILTPAGALGSLVDTLADAVEYVAGPAGSTTRPRADDVVIAGMSAHTTEPGRSYGRALLELRTFAVDERDLSGYCHVLERAWRTRLEQAGVQDVDVQVVWRDSWIRSTAPRR
ncbi:MAG: hypothetical protein ACK5PP_20405 [Acidimicrobiales bacterium]